MKIAIILALTWGLGLSANAGPLTLYVSPQGRGGWSGRLAAPNAAHNDGPLATLGQARDHIRVLKRAGKVPLGGVRVQMREGNYFLPTPLVLTDADSGTADRPVVYEATPGETVRLRGGKTVRGWHRVTDGKILARLDPAARTQVLEADLKAQGITDYGQLTRRGFGQPVQPAGLELFFADRPMTLARWPNEGQWTTITDTPAGPEGGRITLNSNRANRWGTADDVWVHGYWSYDWADTYEHVEGIDPSKRELRTGPTHDLYAYQKGHRFYVLNLLEELDRPGEWYLDRKTGRLFFWPPSPLIQGEAVVSVTPALLAFQNASYVAVRGLTLEACRGTAVTIDGGSHVLVAGCELRDIGNRAVDLRSGTDNGVRSCAITETGDGGIVLNGGDRQTLRFGRNFVINNHIWRYSRWSRTYRPAVQVEGVGNIVRHNLIHDAPHNAIQLSGNEHLIEYNEIHHVCRETGDVGAFYMGRDWTMRGNIVRYNYFHDLGGGNGMTGFHEAMAIYLDDAASGTTVYGNVCVRAGHAVLVGGGRDNRIENNVFVDCRPAISVDSRGLDWAAKYIQPGGSWQMQEKLAAVHYDQPPYRVRYPTLATILQNDPAAPKGNVVAHNIAVRCPKWLSLEGDAAKKDVAVQGNLSDADPHFVDPKRDFALKPDSPALRLGIRSIPFERIGLNKDTGPTSRGKAKP